MRKFLEWLFAKQIHTLAEFRIAQIREGEARMAEQLAEISAERDNLAASLQDEQTQKLILQDRLDSMAEDRGRMWSLLERSIDEMKIAYQMHINAQWQKQGFGAPFSDAPQIAEQAAFRPSREPLPHRETGMELRARKLREFQSKIVENLTPAG